MPALCTRALRSTSLRYGALRARRVRREALRRAGGRGGVEVGMAAAPIKVPASKGTAAVSTCSSKLMSSAARGGSTHLGSKYASGRRHLRRADVQSGQGSPLSSGSARLTPQTEIARPSRARSSTALRKRTRSSQLLKPITTTCGSCAITVGSLSALTSEFCSTSFE